MVTQDDPIQWALALPGVEEKPHFNIPSFRANGKVFTTLWEKENRAMLKLSLIDQDVFCAFGSNVFFPVPEGWGKQGATFVQLDLVRPDMFRDALNQAYEWVTVKKIR